MTSRTRGSRLIERRLPTAEEAARHGAETIFIRRDSRGVDHIIFAATMNPATCGSAWTQWGAPTAILGDNVEDMTRWVEEVGGE